MFDIPTSFTFATATETWQNGLKAIAAGAQQFDLGHVAQADSAAVAVMLQWQKAASEKGTALHYQNVPNDLVSLIAVYQATNILIPGKTLRPNIARVSNASDDVPD